MGEIKKRPQVIKGLIEIATYIGQNCLSTSDNFLLATAEQILSLIFNLKYFYLF